MNWLIPALLITSASAQEIQSISVPDRDLGAFKIEVTERNHPVLLPLRLSVTVQCKDRPGQVLMDTLAVCRFAGHSYDPVSKQLIIEYWISRPREGEGQCDTQVKQPYNLATLCK